MDIDVNKLEVFDNVASRRYEISIGDSVAFLAYDRQGSRILMQHTEVPKEFEGKGVGAKLVKFALDAAKETGMTVVPNCSFVAVYIARHPEYQSVTEK